MTKPRFRILSIDGGGIKGVFPASFLSTLENHCSEPIGRYFDLIAGTSTGGIIAICLSLGLSAREILDFYQSEGPTIFPNATGLASRVRHWFKTKYDPFPLRQALQSVFGDRRISDCQVRLFVPSLNAVNGDIHIFKTRHHPKLVTDESVSLVDVALGTTAAPSYFPPHVTNSDLPLIDGGIWANNPIPQQCPVNPFVLWGSPLCWLGITMYIDFLHLLSMVCSVWITPQSRVSRVWGTMRHGKHSLLLRLDS